MYTNIFSQISDYYNYYSNNVKSYFRVFKQKGIQWIYIQFLLYQSRMKRYKLITNTDRMIKQPMTTRITKHFHNMILDPTHIIDNIYLGNAYNSSNYNIIKKYNIGSVINVTQEIPNYFENDLEYYNIEILDTPEDNFTLHQFRNVLEFIKSTPVNTNILIHCYMGSSRSATIIVLYLINKYGYSIADAIEFVRNKREIVNINKNFINNLRAYRRP